MNLTIVTKKIMMTYSQTLSNVVLERSILDLLPLRVRTSSHWKIETKPLVVKNVPKNTRKNTPRNNTNPNPRNHENVNVNKIDL
jgi:hypothetical protein